VTDGGSAASGVVRVHGGVVAGDHDIPPVDAVLAAVDEQVAGLPAPLRRLAEQVGAAAAVDARDDYVDLRAN
jgi:hypothetical protein